jgi:hypothetical protein
MDEGPAIRCFGVKPFLGYRFIEGEVKKEMKNFGFC